MTALRTQQIIALRSGVADTIDPLAGSYYTYMLTNAIKQEAMELIGRIDTAGGVINCLEDGWIPRQREHPPDVYLQEIERNRGIIVGANRFQIDEETKPPLLKVDSGVEDPLKKILPV